MIENRKYPRIRKIIRLNKGGILKLKVLCMKNDK